MKMRDMINGISAYYYRGSIAYTEDDIPVKKLHFYKVVPQTAENTLKAYFKSFGNVLDLRLGTDPNNMGVPGALKTFNLEEALQYLQYFSSGKDPKDLLEPCLRGDVLYASAEDAARVLRRIWHCIDGRPFEVGPSYSWDQPNAYETPTEQQSQPAPFLSLPDDCWVHILQFLGLRDKVRFARTCQRFRAVYKIATTQSCKTINLGQLDSMTEWDIRDFYQLTGDKVQNLSCSLDLEERDDKLSKIAGYCRNLISLSLQVRVLTKDAILKLPTSIVKLDLSRCKEINDVDIICKHFFKLKELSCNVSDVPEKVWLKIIRENYCPSLEVFHIESVNDSDCQVLAQLPKLKSVTIDSRFLSGDPSERFINQLVVHKAKQLEYLKEKRGFQLPRSQLSLIAKLSGLRTLILPYQEVITADVLEEFANLKKMEEFSFYCNRVSHSDILNFFIACPKLSRFGIHGLPRSEHELVLKIADRVRQECSRKNMHRKLPIELNINWDKGSIEELILKNHRAVLEDIIKINSDDSCYDYNEEIKSYEEYDQNNSTSEDSSDDGWESAFTMSFVRF